MFTFARNNYKLMIEKIRNVKYLVSVIMICVGILIFSVAYYTSNVTNQKELEGFVILNIGTDNISYCSGESGKSIVTAVVNNKNGGYVLSDVYDEVSVRINFADSSYCIIGWVNRNSPFACKYFNDKPYWIDIPYDIYKGKDVSTQVALFEYLYNDIQIHNKHDK